MFNKEGFIVKFNKMFNLFYVEPIHEVFHDCIS